MTARLDKMIQRLDVKIDAIEMVLNSTTHSDRWPSRLAWRGLLTLAKNVVEEYEKEKANNG